MSTRFVVMTKGGKSYIKAGREEIRVNGKAPTVCRGCSEWRVCDGDVSTIEIQRKAVGKLIAWKRCAEAPENLPDTLPAESIYRDSYCERRCTAGYDPECYEPVYGEARIWWEPAEFEVIDRDCEPVALPPWVKVEWPANIEHYPEQQHKYPCRISAKDLFHMVASEVAKRVAENSNVLSWNDHRTIGTFTVSRRVDIPESVRRPERVEYYQSFRSRKPKTKIVTADHRTVKLFTFNGFYENGGRDDIHCPSIRGENFADLQEKVAEYVESIASLCDASSWCVCESCKGVGIIRSKKD